MDHIAVSHMRFPFPPVVKSGSLNWTASARWGRETALSSAKSAIVRATRQTRPSDLPDRPRRSAARVRNPRASPERWDASSEKGARTVPFARHGLPAYRPSWIFRHRFTRSRTWGDGSPEAGPYHSDPAIGSTDTDR